MKIVKRGKTNSKPKIEFEQFECDLCGCKFNAEEDEYYVDKAPPYDINTISLSYSWSSIVNDMLVCSCPECHKIVKKTRQRTVSNPVIGTTVCEDYTSRSSTNAVEIGGTEASLCPDISVSTT